MTRHGDMHRTALRLLAITGLVAFIITAPAAAESRSPVPSGAVAGSCGVERGTLLKLGTSDAIFAEAYQGRESLTFADVAAPADLSESPLLDLLGGTELPLTLTLDDGSVVPVTSLVAVLVLDGRGPVWFGPYGPDHASLTVPLGAVGQGALHVLAGTCQDWTFTGSWPTTIADPATAADCPTNLAGLHDWFDHTDQSISVAGTTIDSMGLRGGIRARYVPVHDDSGTYGGHYLVPQERDIRLDAGQRFTVRAHDRTVDVPEVTARFTGPPTAREVRAGWTTELRPPAFDGHAQLDGHGGFTLVAPRKPGRYLLRIDPVWRTRCLNTQDAELLLTVLVRQGDRAATI